jgi:hypothetical protein
VYSLYAIGLTDASTAAASLLQRIADLIPDDAEAFAAKHESPFEYTRVITAVAERQPGPAMLPALESLHAKACLRGQCVPAAGDGRATTEPVSERLAYLELCVARALARCGHPRGYAVLRQYTDDIRGTLARSAVDELRALSVQIPGTVQPYRQRID